MSHKFNDEYFMVCPRCGSINTFSDLSKDMMAWGAPTRWLCKDCDYSAITFPELKKSQLNEFRHKIKHRAKEDTDVIETQNVSKGILNKTINKWFVFFEISAIVVSAFWGFSEGYLEQNYILMGISILIVLVIAVILRNSLK